MLKNIRPVFLGLAMAAAGSGAMASTVSVDFNGISSLLNGSPTAPLSNQFSSIGLSFSANNGTAVLLVDANYKGFGIPANGTGKPGEGFVRGRDFTITLASSIEVNLLTLNISQPSDNGATDPITIEVFGRGGHSSTYAPFGSGNGSEFTWPASAFSLDFSNSGFGTIDHIVLSSKQSVSFGIDNLQFSLAGPGSTVPEPAGLALVALALSMAGVASRRRRAG
jgi:hypothetical protein